MKRPFRPSIETLPRLEAPSTLYMPIDTEEIYENTEIGQLHDLGAPMYDAHLLPDGPIIAGMKELIQPNMLPAPVGGGIVNPVPAPTTPYLPAGTQIAPGPQTTPYMYPGPLASPNPIVIVYPATNGLSTGGLALAPSLSYATVPVTAATPVALPVNPLA